MRDKYGTQVGRINSHSKPLDAEYARLHRVLQIIQLIQQQDGWNAKSLARACGVTERTIYRDLILLQGANIPFFFDEERRCYRIRQDFFMPPIDLALDEVLALVALGEEIGKKEQIPFTMAAAPGGNSSAGASAGIAGGA
ncbi:MAG: HTH domain-containing protein [Phycisphaeraceae bacterium]|nr:HTH domain-containing protein [Phycisphaeraceae bacterium]